LLETLILQLLIIQLAASNRKWSDYN